MNRRAPSLCGLLLKSKVYAAECCTENLDIEIDGRIEVYLYVLVSTGEREILSLVLPSVCNL